MNRTFKVVYNKARGALTVVNEATKSVQKAGTKTIAASAVMLALTTPVLAEDVPYTQDSGSRGYSATTADSKTMVFEEGKVLKMTITGQQDTRAYGLLATGEGAVYTNMGTIQTNLATGDDTTQAYRVKGMMADNGGKAVNKGLIEVTNAYGMTVGSTGKNTLENNGDITVNGGVAMEIAPTGVPETTAGNGAVASNDGTITVTEGIGILMAGKEGAFTSTGTINASGQTAVQIQAEAGKTTSGNRVTLAKESKTSGDILIQGVAAQKPDVAANLVKGTSLVIEDGAEFDGRIIVGNATETLVQATVDFVGQASSNGGAIFFNDSTGVLNLSGSNFTNNKAGTTTGAGGAVYSYAKTFVQTGGSYVGNQAVSKGYVGNEQDPGKVQDGAMGGALLIKGNEITLENVLFENNSAVATKTEDTVGGAAYGGAIVVDYSTGYGDGTGQNRKADLTIKVTKDIAYTGNTVSSDSAGTNFDTYGYHVPTSAAGGFLFLDRGSGAVFDVTEGATLTIGAEGTTGDTDSIASSIPNQGTNVNKGLHAFLNKTGSGNLVVNSSLDKYYGNLTISGGRMQVNSAWNIKNLVTVDGGTLALSNIAFDDAAHKNDDQINLGKITVTKGGLETASGEVFKTAASTEVGLSTDSGEFKYSSDKISISEGGSLVLNDAEYTLGYAKTAQTALTDVNKDAKLVMLGQIVDVNGDAESKVTIEDVATVSGDTVLAGTTVTTENRNLTVGGKGASGDASRTESLGVAALDMGSGSTLTVTGDKEVTLVGTGAGNHLVSSSAEKLAIDLNSGVLNLGSVAVSKGGVLNAEVSVDGSSAVNVAGGAEYSVTSIIFEGDGSQLNVYNGASLTVDSLSGSGDVTVGNAGSAGSFTLKSAEGFTGMIFADPDWNADESLNTIANASFANVLDVGGSFAAQLVAGRNAVVAVGATRIESVAAFEKLAAANGLSWKNDVTAMAYINAPVEFADTGAIVVNGSLTQSPENYEKGVSVASQGMLMVNQATAVDNKAYITGTVNLAQGSYLGLINAKEGSFILTDKDNLTDEGAMVVTDNPFIEGSLDAATGTVTGKLDTQNGLRSLASLGLQAVTRRADSVLAATIADRTSFGQDLKPGVNLWVDVAGENYQMDDLDNGGEFNADIGYGTFGADVAVGQFTLGGALQYGTGTLRSSVSNIKNRIDNYAVSLYGTYNVTDAFRLGAELAYVWGENDITSNQAALNGSVDTEMYSAGVRAMYELKAGNFSFVPSIGLRVSQLSTDAMQIGTVRVEDQDQTLVQLPIALRVSASEFATQTGWSLSPSFKIAYVPTFGDKEITVGGVDSDVIDTSPVQMDFGIFAGRDNLLVNASFAVGAGKEGSSSVGGRIGLKYAF